MLKTRPIVCFCNDSTHVFILSAPRHFTIFFRELSFLIFLFINKLDLSRQLRAFVFYMINKAIRGYLYI